MEIKDFFEISPCRWKLEKKKHRHMKADAEIFATQEILQQSIEDASIQQVINVSALPTIISPSLAMPDIHYGYGFCIGGVAAFPDQNGIVLPGGVGYDINCGVRLLATEIPWQEIDDLKEVLGSLILSQIPTGLSCQSRHPMNKSQFQKVLTHGAEEIVNRLSGRKDDLDMIESRGRLPFSNPDLISKRAYERGYRQVGTLGSGNHFIEVQLVDQIYDEATARIFALKKGHISIMIHTGSRGFGHQVASDYIEKMRRKNLHRIRVRDPQLVYAEINSTEGRQYLQALNAASNFAWANRQLIMQDLIALFEQQLGSSREKLGIRIVYDQAHNICKFEQHKIGNKLATVLVHRKGATRAFPPGHVEVPETYRQVGQPVIIPGSMGTASYILKGTSEAMDLTFGSSAHGAGRRMSRHKALKFSAGLDVREALKARNILVFSKSSRGLREEIPEAYKEIDTVIETTERAGISKKVARLLPLVVVKG